jgi:hypothetical protein
MQTRSIPRQPRFTTRLGTARAWLVVALLGVGIGPAAAQEDVAETKTNLQIDTTPITEPKITESDREHWAFQPIQRHPLPTTNDREGLRNSIDVFILAKLEAKSLSLSPEADRPTLLRRVTFDLTGLPPTPAELITFEADQSPDAYERQLDRLLASPSFGERYAQHWLDLARFAETDGYEHDKVRASAWKFRDWTIAALNADLPYDEFIALQLAGDELDNRKSKIENLKSEIPTMFCLSGPDMPDVNDQLERRHNLLNEMTSAVGAVFLGLQLGCAQCHNHKYDPISQADFYRLRAVFEPAVATLKRDAPFNVLALQREPETPRFWIRGDHRRPGLELPPAFPRIASSIPTRRASEGEPSAPTTHHSPRTELAAWLTRDDNPLTSRVLANRLWQWHFGRGLCQTPSDFGVMGGPITHPELLDWLAMEFRASGWNMKRLHRAMVSSATYRQTSSNLEFRIQNSEKGAQHSAFSILNSAFASDPDNDLYSRFPRQRLSGETIRDALLAAAGLLSAERGGPGVMPPLPQELLSTLLKNQWSASKREADHYKRSIYVFARRNLRYPIFEAFDRPDANATCPIRNRSTTAPQSLLLLNSELSLLAAQHLAGRVLVGWAVPTTSPAADEIDNQIDRLYLITLSRRPTTEESAALERFLTQQRARLAQEARPPTDLALPIPSLSSADPYRAAALVDACLALLNTNEFIYID